MLSFSQSLPALDVGNIAQLIPQDNGFVKSFDVSKVDIKNVQHYMIMDATSSYSKSMKGSVTTQPVSNRTEIGDHVTLEQPEFNITGVITRQNAAFGYKWRMDEAGTGTIDRIKDFVGRLTRCMRVKHPFTVYLPDGLVETNCVITNVEFSRGVNEHNVLNVDMTLQKVNVITSTIIAKTTTRTKNITAPVLITIGSSSTQVNKSVELIEGALGTFSVRDFSGQGVNLTRNEFIAVQKGEVPNVL
jgi:hypothetical protein